MTVLSIAVLSRTGDRSVNEDACGYWQDQGPACCVLSDGAGGHGGGDVASRLCVRQVLAGFAAQPELTAANVARLLDDANHAVVDAQRAGGSQVDMRATLVMLLIDPATGQAIWGHAGDSRLYWLRDGRVRQRTHDHSLFQSLLDAGFVTEAQREGHAGSDILTTAVGSLDAFRPEFEDEPVTLADGDAFLLCSDGLWRTLSDAFIAGTLDVSDSPQDWLEQLAARVQGDAVPGQDNYTALAVWCGSQAR